MRYTTISNSENVLDSRDIIARIEELQDERNTLQGTIDTAKEAHEEEETDKGAYQDDLEAVEEALSEWDESEEGNELKVLLALQEEAEASPDWKYGETLIRDTYFETYARELAEDCGMIEKCDTWPGRCIDWEQAADELKQDYFSVDFDGQDYWIRA